MPGQPHRLPQLGRSDHAEQFRDRTRPDGGYPEPSDVRIGGIEITRPILE